MDNINSNSRCLQGGIRTCGGCSEKILDRFLLLALDQYWHVNCLKCSCCSVRLGEVGTSCYAKGGMILCKTDYVKLYGSSGACAVCAKLIPATELVMKVLGKVYHLNCFNCTTCHNQLVAGDRFHVVNGRLFCENDDPRLLKQQLHATKQTLVATYLRRYLQILYVNGYPVKSS
ncbi:LIM domain transcription factor LMO4.2 [Acropora cervicornis]|uniref:LIM domain transcription factor LMO4.2 n=1 Tax=Acropora cervicornis TaxID=6130 RepID=A0AAD9VAI6_ACRCE|nr:LIM domain transcription factor LMO4.2 [Acropora cervicornis]